MEQGMHDPIRATWGAKAKQAGMDVQFFMGKAPDTENTRHIYRYQRDEVVLPCQDDYQSLPFKTRDICKWATGKITDFVFLCDTDTYVDIDLMLRSGFKDQDYLGEMPYAVSKIFQYKSDAGGKMEIRDRCRSWASGGVGYFLSKRALTEVAYSYPDSWAEDLWVGQVIMPLVAEGEMRAMNTRENNYCGSKFSWHYPIEELKVKNPELIAQWLKDMDKQVRS